MILFTEKHKIPFQVDDDLAPIVLLYTWAIGVPPYPQAHAGPNGRSVRLHVFLFGAAPVGMDWDHINKDRLDNRRENLRLLTRSANMHNVGLLPSNTSGVRGVYWRRDVEKWCVQMRVGKERRNLGVFDSLTAAAAVRSEAERLFWESQEHIAGR